jgi:hypothetical protein
MPENRLLMAGPRMMRPAMAMRATGAMIRPYPQALDAFLLARCLPSRGLLMASETLGITPLEHGRQNSVLWGGVTDPPLGGTRPRKRDPRHHTWARLTCDPGPIQGWGAVKPA